MPPFGHWSADPSAERAFDRLRHPLRGRYVALSSAASSVENENDIRGADLWLQVRPNKIDVPADRSILRLSAPALSRRLPDPQDADGKREEVMVRLGGAASPTYVGIFRGLQAHFLRHGIELDWVIYSDYDALVEAFARREIDLAWNAPLAYVKSNDRT